MGKKAESTVRFSIIIPVFHEKNNLNFLLDRLNTLEPIDKFEIIVVDGIAQQRIP